MELFLNLAGLRMVHVRCQGAAAALVDVVGGVPRFAGNILNALPHVRSGKVRAYGVTSARRSSGAPEIPAIAEAGLPGYEALQSIGLLAPAGTPRAIVAQLHAAVVRALQDPEIRKRFLNDGAQPTPSGSPEAFGAFMRAEAKKWAKVVRDAGLRPE